MKVLLYDPIHGGHHDSYAVQLAQGLLDAGCTVMVMGPRPLLTAVLKSTDGDKVSVVELSRTATNTGDLSKARMTSRVLEAGRTSGADIIHFLYLDRHILAMLPLLGQSDLAHVRATLHWGYFLNVFAPSRARQARGVLEVGLLKELTRRGMRLLVHSRAVQAALNKLLNRNCTDYVPYPAEPRTSSEENHEALRQHTRNNLGIPQDVRLLLAFGGTRHDKGADIAIEALSSLPENYHLLIAGSAESFTREMLAEQSLNLGVYERTHFILEHIAESAVEPLFLAADALILPYRKIFAGQSGPLTIAGALGVPVIAANVIVLQETIESFKLGVVFQAESAVELARATETYFLQPLHPNPEVFVKAHALTKFIEANRQSYELTRFKG